VIFKSDGADSLGLLSMACVYPLPKVFESPVKPKAPASAPLVKNERLENGFCMILFL
jgi:hypothetical protein